MSEFWMENYIREHDRAEGHGGGAFNSEWLLEIEKVLPKTAKASAETGCGKSTILFSNISQQHTVFTYDDRKQSDSSINFFMANPMSRKDRVDFVLGSTQVTLRHYDHKTKYDIVMLDGPHGWPFPELEYYFFYPQIANGGWLIVDDVAVPTIGRMADVIAEDAMWRLHGVIGNSALFQRTDAPTFNPHGDDWWQQGYNKHRAMPHRLHYADGGPVYDRITALQLEAKIHSRPK